MTNNTPNEKSKQKNREFIPNFTQYPNEILDEWMPHLTGNQFMILSVFVRYIYGYHKHFDRISFRQICEKTHISYSCVFKDVKYLLKIGVISISSKGNRKYPNEYQINNITDKLRDKKPLRVYIGDTPQGSHVILQKDHPDTTEESQVILHKDHQKKEINIKEKCEIKENQQQAHAPQVKFEANKNEPFGNSEQFGKTEQQHEPKLEDIKQDDYLRAFAIKMGVDIDNITEEEYTKPTTEIALPKRTEEEINLHYSQEIAKVEQELVAQRDINLPKLTTESLLGASEEFLGRVGIGFDNNPRRILNLIYKSLPSDCVIKEDGKDVEILGDMIKKYMASRQDERESIAKRIYQAVEAMLKIYVIKKYGEPYREVLYPEILRANLTLYINCNPTFKYCLGGFSNDIDGVYTEICRLAEKDARKKIEQVKIEHSKKIRQLEANRQAEIRSMFSETEISDFQKRNDDILRRMDAKGDIEDMPLNKPIQANLTEEEKQELNLLFVKADKSSEDVIRMNFLIRKSRKL